MPAFTVFEVDVVVVAPKAAAAATAAAAHDDDAAADVLIAVLPVAMLLLPRDTATVASVVDATSVGVWHFSGCYTYLAGAIKGKRNARQRWPSGR